MKRWIGLLLTLCLLLAGCGKPAQIDKSQTPWVVPSELLGQSIKDALQKDWDWWNGLGKNQLYYSPIDAASGHQSFDSWTDCEEFVGLIVPNPLESCDFLEKGTYVGMPIGFADASRMEVSWHGDQEGHFCKVTLCAGYYSGDVRLQFWAKVYGDPVETVDGRRHMDDAMRTDYLEHTGGTGAYIEEEGPGRYGCCSGTLAKGHVLYYVNVVGPGDKPEASRAMLDRVLELLETIETE